MKIVKMEVTSEEKASRIELLLRLVYWIPLIIVAYVLHLIAAIVWFVNILSILVLGKRFAIEWVTKALQYYAKFGAYMMLATDERPPIIPE